MNNIDSIKINFNQDQLFLLNICLAFIMFGIALDLKWSHFKALFQQPKAVFIGLISQLILLPFLTLLLVAFFRPAASLALGMVLVAVCPGGNVSNFAVHLAKANTALSITLTTISTLSAILVTPIYFSLLAPMIVDKQQISADIFVNPWSMVSTIFVLLLIPLIAGMLFSYRFPKWTARIHKPVSQLSMLIFLGFVLTAAYANMDNIVKYLYLVFILVLAHNAMALLAGYAWAWINRLPRADARAIALETGIQNSGLGLVLIFNFFNGLGGMAMIAAWWGIWHLISAFSLATLWRQRKDL
ncbi:MAG TPA: bile acid:sodium symporter family protein [Saprospiraceae bacterium]|nr:bile acid:sodium symporter family protein [Saprospiraceae bacterium]HMQ81967.1 bile acid:sodium symporter family protein [Saprospiraceae bacterium]